MFLLKVYILIKALIRMVYRDQKQEKTKSKQNKPQNLGRKLRSSESGNSDNADELKPSPHSYHQIKNPFLFECLHRPSEMTAITLPLKET